jgi:tryptophanyl-tRNA synthetase
MLGLGNDRRTHLRFQRDIAEIVGKEYPAFAGMTQPGIKKWIDNSAAYAGNLSPPDSRQHFDIWQFQTADIRSDRRHCSA